MRSRAGKSTTDNHLILWQTEQAQERQKLGLGTKVRVTKQVSISEAWRKRQIMSMDELALKEASIEAFFQKCDERIEAKRRKLEQRRQLSDEEVQEEALKAAKDQKLHLNRKGHTWEFRSVTRERRAEVLSERYRVKDLR